MRSILTVFIFIILLVSATQAQDKGMEKAYNEACACFTALKNTKLTEAEQKAKGMECMQTTMINNIEVIAKESGYKPNELNAETGRAMGEKFGRVLVSRCPEFMKFSLVAAQDIIAEHGISEVAAYLSSGTTEGTFVRLESNGDSPKLVVKTSDGSEETFLWIRPFKGSDILEKQYKTLVDKKVSVHWGEFSKYVFAMKGYAKVKEIISITIN